MKRFEKATKDVHERATHILKQFHPDLHAQGVKIDYIFVYAATDEASGEPTGPALKCHGYPASGVSRIVNLKDRTMGRGDAEVLLDGDRWPNMKPEEQDALLDHELTHFVVSRDIEGSPLLDAEDRPKLKMKQHDHQIGIFNVIAQRYGKYSGEVQNIKAVFTDAAQLYFPFIEAIVTEKQLA